MEQKNVKNWKEFIISKKVSMCAINCGFLLEGWRMNLSFYVDYRKETENGKIYV